MANGKELLRVEALYAYPERSIAYPLLCRFEYPWEALSSISDFILEMGAVLPKEEYDQIGENIWIAKSATVAKTAMSIKTTTAFCIIYSFSDSMTLSDAFKNSSNVVSL